jgi:tRNA (adenine22-N1)-methyltransferase
MVKEDGKYYVMMKAVPEGFIKDERAYVLSEQEHFYYGRLLLEGRHPVLKEFLTWDLGLCLNILQALANEKTDNAVSRQEEIKEKIGLINCALKYYYNNQQEER